MPDLLSRDAGEDEREHDRRVEYQVGPDKDPDDFKCHVLVSMIEEDAFDLAEDDVLHEEHRGAIEDLDDVDEL